MIRNESDVAAIILEPVVGTNGVLVPPPEYFPRLREICDRHGVLMIADEVMAGWGRTGKWFAVDHWGVTPDILVTAKGITRPICRWVSARLRQRLPTILRITTSRMGTPMKPIR